MADGDPLTGIAFDEVRMDASRVGGCVPGENFRNGLRVSWRRGSGTAWRNNAINRLGAGILTALLYSTDPTGHSIGLLGDVLRDLNFEA